MAVRIFKFPSIKNSYTYVLIKNTLDVRKPDLLKIRTNENPDFRHLAGPFLMV